MRDPFSCDCRCGCITEYDPNVWWWRRCDQCGREAGADCCWFRGNAELCHWCTRWESGDKPASSDQSASGDTPASSDKLASGDKPASGVGASGDKPSSSEEEVARAKARSKTKRPRRPLCQRCRAHRPGRRIVCPEPSCHRKVGPGCARPEGPCWDPFANKCTDCASSAARTPTRAETRDVDSWLSLLDE